MKMNILSTINNRTFLVWVHILISQSIKTSKLYDDNFTCIQIVHFHSFNALFSLASNKKHYDSFRINTFHSTRSFI